MTYRGLPADYDAWKTRSDRDDGPDDEFEPEPEEEDDDMINENELAKELTDVMTKDPVSMPKTAGLKANGGQSQPTISDDIDRLIARLHSTIRGLEMLKGTL
jgi:hypothetical protein